MASALDLLLSRQAAAAGVGIGTRRNQVLPAPPPTTDIPERIGRGPYKLRKAADPYDDIFSPLSETSYAARTGDQPAMLALLTDGKDHYYTAAEALGQGGGGRINGLAGQAEALQLPLDAAEEQACSLIAVVVGVHDVAAIGRHPARELPHQPRLIGADHLQDGGGGRHGGVSPSVGALCRLGTQSMHNQRTSGESTPGEQALPQNQPAHRHSALEAWRTSWLVAVHAQAAPR